MKKQSVEVLKASVGGVDDAGTRGNKLPVTETGPNTGRIKSTHIVQFNPTLSLQHFYKQEFTKISTSNIKPTGLVEPHYEEHGRKY